MQVKLTDEMMARYLSGKATPEEEEAVLDYISESDERLDDLLAMSASVEQFGEAKPRANKRPLWPVLSAAASVALLIGIGIAVWQMNRGNTVKTDPTPSYAQQDSIGEPNMEDTL